MKTGQSSIADDMRYLRELAEAGKTAPLEIGPYLIAGGAWFAGASFLLGLGQQGWLPVTEAWIPWTFLAAALASAIHLGLLFSVHRNVVEQGRNRFINTAWQAAGFGILAFCIAVTLLTLRSQQPVVLSTISLVVLSIYGLIWWMCASLTGYRWMRNVAILSFFSAMVVAWFANTPFVWLAYSLALVLSALLPGIYIVRSQQVKV